MKNTLRILMVATENGALPDAKVGGIGAVIQYVPPALADQNCEVSVVTPSYGFLHKLEGSQYIHTVHYEFGGQHDSAEMYRVPSNRPHKNVRQFVLDNQAFVSQNNPDGRYEIYHHDLQDRLFATDATRFARFSIAVAEAVKQGMFGGSIDQLHCHDWPTGFLLILQAYHPDYASLQKIHTVYTIHNLTYQGIRPLNNDESSLSAWFPDLEYERKVVADPRWVDCVNPMKAAIRLADVVHTVSPSYKNEILKPSIPPFYGGEGLEESLLQAEKEGRLFGILNGCTYPENPIDHKLAFPELLNLLKSVVLQWAGTQQHLSASYFVAYTRLNELSCLYKSTEPNIILSSVSRITDQKTYLLRAPGTSVTSGIEGILEGLGTEGVYILLGSGDANLVQFLTEVNSRYKNFVFLNGFSDTSASTLFLNGDLFLMPSSFEPGGISQLQAMKQGQPPLVHGVGGLKDTVKDHETGFVFEGTSEQEQVNNLITSLLEAIRLKREDPVTWQRICNNARKTRFLWKDTAKKYMKQLYQQKKILSEEEVII